MKIVLIGAGNLGYHLGRKLHGVGEEVIQVFSRKLRRASKLAKLLSAQPTNSLDHISIGADLYIIAAHDDVIKSIGEKLAANGCRKKLVAHTSGAIPKAIFDNTGLTRYGIFYPLQTFSISKEPDFLKIPFCVDANAESDIYLLKKLALKISPNFYHINDGQKTLIHLAAVFVNNFTNHLFHIANDILKKESVPFEILLPLIEETVDKIKNNDPKEMQTGPAVREDKETINRHLQLLKLYPGYKKLYQQLTKSIQETHLVK